MILLEVVDAERRKVASDRSPEAGPTRRQPESSSSSSSASPPAEPQLPDYDTSQAQAKKLKEQDEEVDIDAEKSLAKWKERRLTRWIVRAISPSLAFHLLTQLPAYQDLGTCHLPLP